jgi:hypothetical protein
MSDKGDKISIRDTISGIYGLGVIACTIIWYGGHGFWEAFGFGLIWPFVAIWALRH